MLKQRIACTLAMKILRHISLSDFEAVREVRPRPWKESVVSTILERYLGEKEAGVFELNVNEFMGVQRHIKVSKRKGIVPKFDAKVIRFTGSGPRRVYQIAIAKPKQ